MADSPSRTVAVTPQALERLGRVVRDAPLIGFDTETAGPSLVGKKRRPNPHAHRLVGFSVADGAESWYVPIAHRRGQNAPVAAARRLYAAVWQRSPQSVAVWNAVFERHIAANEGVDVDTPDRCVLRDAAVDWWHLGRGVLFPGGRVSYKLKDVARERLGVAVTTFDETALGRRWDDVDPAEQGAAAYACADAENTLALATLAALELEEADPRGWCRTVEQPFSWILWSMERQGVTLDYAHLDKLVPRLEERAHALAAEWLRLSAGVQIGSGKQRAQLYQDGVWTSAGVDLTKSGELSTGREAAKQQLVALTERTRKGRLGRRLAALYLRWSAVDKIRSTYGHTLANQAWQHPDGRLHSSYSHVGTRTGRLSSSAPNLQNIPVRTALGKAIAAAMIARDGHVFVACDYSQIELRVLAHLAGAGKLLEAYAAGADIHQQTADMCGVPRDPHAKTGNFAYVYGAGVRKLARTFGSPLQLAQQFVSRYEAGYPEVPALRAEYVRAARDDGYVSTMSGRRRWLPGVRSSVSRERYAAERQAFNTPIQGGARDLMALGMLRYWRALRAAGLAQDVRFSGQIHDDLVVEAPEPLAARAGEMMSATLCAVARLRVPLQADARTGRTYAELKGG